MKRARSAQGATRRPVAAAASPSGPGSAGGVTWADALAALFVALTALLLYANSFAVPFVFDDQRQILANTEVRSWRGIADYVTRSRGVVLLTLTLNYLRGGREAWGYHLFNLIVHSANGLLAYALARATLCRPMLAARFARHARFLALVTAVLFVAHPLQTMAVTYVIQRTESIAVFFMLATLTLFAVGAGALRQSTRIAAHAAAAFTCYLGMISKENAVVMPLLVLLYDWYFVAAGGLRDLRRRWPVHALLICLAATPVVFQRGLLSGGPAQTRVASEIAVAGVTPISLSSTEEDLLARIQLAQDFPATAGFGIGLQPLNYLGTQFGVVLWYLRLYLLPTSLCLDYAWPIADSFFRTDVLLPLVTLLALAAAGIWCLRGHRVIAFSTAAFFIALAPTSSILPIRDAAFEHRMYLPVFFLSLLAVTAVFDLLRRLALQWHWAERRTMTMAAIGLGTWIAALGSLTVARNAVYRDPLRLWTDTVAKAPHNLRAHYNRGDALENLGRYDEAQKEFELVRRSDPQDGGPYLGLMYIHMKRNMLEQAAEVATAATQLNQRLTVATAYRTLGTIAEIEERWEDAAHHYRIAGRLKPEWGYVRQHLGLAYAQQGRWAEAADELDAAIRLDPALTEATRKPAGQTQLKAALELLSAGDPEAACKRLSIAVRHHELLIAAYPLLARCHAEHGQWPEAERMIETALRLSPSEPGLHAHLERVRARQLPIVPGFPGDSTPAAEH